MSQPDQTGDRLKVALCTREYPPEVYGGAGVHVEYLAKELSKHVALTVHCQGADRPTAVAHRPWDRLENDNPALQTIRQDCRWWPLCATSTWCTPTPGTPTWLDI